MSLELLAKTWLLAVRVAIFMLDDLLLVASHYARRLVRRTVMIVFKERIEDVWDCVW